MGKIITGLFEIWTSPHLAQPLLPVGVEDLQKAFPLSWSRAIALIPFHSIRLSFKIIWIPSFQVCWDLPLGLFPSVLSRQAILVCHSFPILKHALDHLTSNSIISLRGNYCNLKKKHYLLPASWS